MPALSAVLALLAPGCYFDHGRSTPRDSGLTPPTYDAGTPVPTVPPHDAGHAADAYIPPSCTPTPADFACSDTGTGFVPAGRPYSLPVYFGDGERCYCGEQLRCTARIAEPFVLELTTYQCADMLCDGCYPFVEGRCDLPPLAEGSWRVHMNGQPVFMIDASNAVPGVGPVDVCQTHPRDRFGCGSTWPPDAERIDQYCHDARAIAGMPVPVEITDFCHSCGLLWGPCIVTRAANLITLRPTSLASACEIDCPAECALDEATCIIPPLEPGEYAVSIEGLPGSTQLLVTGGVDPGPGRACNSIPED